MNKFLYNDNEFDLLPQYDKTIYPKVVIVRTFDNTGAESDGVFLYMIGEHSEFSYDGNNICLSYTKILYYTAMPGSRWIDSGQDDFSSSQIMDLYRPSTADRMGVKPIWANFDIKQKDGTIFLEASLPVPVPLYLDSNMKQFMLYNGKKLPALPLEQLDQSRYPYGIIQYAAIFGPDTGFYSFISLATFGTEKDNELVMESKKACQLWIAPANKKSEEYWKKQYPGISVDSWLFVQQYEDESGPTILSNINWSNFDIVGEDGAVYLEGTRPSFITKFEYAFLAGLLLGRRIRGQQQNN